MSLLSQWLLSAACLIGGLILNKGLRRLNIPKFPWRLPWIALTSWAIETTLISLGVPGASTLNFNVLNQLIIALATSRLIVWFFLDLLPKLHLLPQCSRIFKDCLFILIGSTLAFINLQQQANIDLAGLITTSAVLTAVLGLAAQEPLKDLIGGMSLELEQVISEGDWVNIDNQIGQVTSISWRGTELRCQNGARVILPHATVSTKNICNYSSFGPHRDRISIELSNRIQPHIVQKLMKNIAKHHPLVLSTPTTIARIERFETNSIIYEWLVWHRNYNDRFQARGELQEQLWYAINRECTSSAYPVQRVALEPKEHPSIQPKTTDAPQHEQSIKLLQKHAMFEHLSDDQFLHIAHRSPIHIYGKGEIIVSESELGDSLFMVIEGSVMISKKADDERLINVAELQSGDIFGEMTLFTGETRCASARCLSNVEAMEVKRETLATMMAEDPALLNKMGQLISDRKAKLQNLQEEHLKAHAHRDTIELMQRLFTKLLS